MGTVSNAMNDVRVAKNRKMREKDRCMYFSKSVYIFFILSSILLDYEVRRL